MEAPLTAEAKKARVSEQFGQLPLHFEPNRGQMDKRVEYLSRGQGYTLMLTRREAILSLSASDGKGAAVRMKTVGSNGRPEIVAEEKQEGRSNYFLGKDRSKWQSDVPHYGRVRYREVYPGIDQVYYGNQGQLEYDFVVAPGADPNQIRLKVDGVDRMKVDGQGDLVMEIAGCGELKQSRPVVYQEVNGERRVIEAHFEVRGKREVSFELGSYDRSQALVIDPVLVYSTFLGGGDNDRGLGITVDNKGNAYLTGETYSADFPTTPGAFQPTLSGNANVFVTKLNASGTAPVYSTFFGGTYRESGEGIAVDEAGCAYVTGSTYSTDFPTTPGAFQTTPSIAGDAFVTKLDQTGKPIYSTFIGGNGSDRAYGIAIDEAGNAYVTGDTSSLDFPTTTGAFQTMFGGLSDAFVFKLNASGTKLVYSTFMGGAGLELGSKIVVDNEGSAYYIGSTQSANFPVTPAAFQKKLGGSLDISVTKLSPNGSSLVYSTFLGGNKEQRGSDIAIDNEGNAYLTGYTTSEDYPTTPGAFQTFQRGTTDAVVTKLNASGTAPVYSTFLGGDSDDYGYGIAIDDKGNAYLTGLTASENYPITSNAYQKALKFQDPFVTQLDSTGSSLLYSTFLGGYNGEAAEEIVIDNKGSVYLIGTTVSDDFPTTSGAFQTKSAGRFDVFGTKLDLSAVACPVMTISPEGILPAAFGAIYPDQLMKVNGAAKPMIFSVDGTLPPWMALSTTGFLSGGLVESLGYWSFRITAKDESGCEVSQNYQTNSYLSATAELCLKDDNSPGKTMMIDFGTGSYKLVAGAVRLSGKGDVKLPGGLGKLAMVELVDRSGGNIVTVTVNRLTGMGQATVRIAGTPVQTVFIRDANVTDNGCAIRP